MAIVSCVCSRCGRRFDKERGQLNRARRAGPHLYCSLVCTGKARRKPKLPLAKRRAKKAAYDKIRRELLRDELREQKREYFQRTYDPDKARRVRAERKRRLGAHYHRDYCRARVAKNPALKRGKRLYDRARRYRMQYGEFRECARLLWLLTREVSARYFSSYERRKARGYYLTPHTQERKRNAQISRW